MIPFEACQYCLSYLSSQSELLAPLYLQVCLGYLKGTYFRYNEEEDFPVRALIKHLEKQGFVLSLDNNEKIIVIPIGRYILHYPEEDISITLFCSCGKHEIGE